MAKADTLTLFFFPSPFGIDWSSPRAMTTSSIINTLSRKPRSIGHVSIEICQYEGDSDKPIRRIHTGMTQLHKSEHLPLIAQKGIGLGLLFFALKGTLEEAPALDEEIDRRTRVGSLTFLKFEISRSASDRALKYAEEYREMDCQSQYGLHCRPLHGEGAGCSAFAASFLEVTGLMRPEFRANWTRLIRVQESLIGRPIKDRYVSFAQLLFGRTSRRWAEMNEPHREIFFWDPDLMYRWVLKVWGTAADKLESIRINNAKGILIQAFDVTPPEGAFFVKPQPKS